MSFESGTQGMDTVGSSEAPGNVELETKSSQEQDPTLPYALTISCVGILANAFVLVVIFCFTKMTKTLSGLLIFNQTWIDFATSLCTAGHDVVELYVSQRQVPIGGILGDLYCRVYYGKLLVHGLTTASTVNLVVLTIERYLCVVHPIFHKTNLSTARRVRRLLVGTPWLLGIGSHAAWSLPSTEIVQGKCYPLLKVYSSSGWTLANSIFTACQYLFVPVCVMIFCYSHMAVVLKSGGTTLETSSALSSKLSHTQINLLKTMATVCICFVIGWTGSVLVWLLYLGGAMKLENLSTALFYPTLLRLSNMSVNPFIYILQYQEFKKGLRRMKNRIQPSTTIANLSSIGGDTKT